MNRVIYGLALVALCSLAACDKKDEPAPTAPSPSAATETTAAAAPSAVPSEEDFEEQAEQQITAANLKDELAKIEKEIP